MLVLIFLALGGYAVLRSSKGQTYITQVIASYFSSKLNTTVTVKGVDIEFFNKVLLEGLYVEDLHQDTLLYLGELKLGIQSFDLDSSRFRLSSIGIKNTRFNVVKYKGEKELNLQFLIDAFDTGDTSTIKKTNIPQFRCKNISLSNIDFSYRYEDDTVSNVGINYSDIRVKKVSGAIKNVFIEGDTIHGEIQNLSCIEKSGFELKYFNAVAKVSPIQTELQKLEFITNNSHIKTNITFTYQKYEDYNDFIENVYMQGNFQKSRLEMNDIAYFAPELEGMHKTITFNGEIKGTVSGLKGKNMNLAFGESSYFKGDIKLTGLPNINETYLQLNVDEALTNSKDLRSIPIQPFVDKKYLKIPKELDKLGNIKFNGDFTGFIYDFVAYGTFKTAIGVISSDIALQEDKKKETFTYHGNIKARNFDLGKLVDAQKIIGKISLDADIKGKGLTINTINADVKGKVQQLEFNNYNYKNINIEGNFAKNIFKGAFDVQDENIALEYKGDIDFTGNLPLYKFTAIVKNADLDALNIIKTGNQNSLVGDFDVNISGNNLDNISGSVSSKKIVYNENGKDYIIKDFDVSSQQNRSIKSITLRSNVVDADFKGVINLEYFAESMQGFVAVFIPALSNKGKNNTSETTENFSYSINFKEPEALSKLLLKDLVIKPNTLLDGAINTETSKFSLNFVAPEIIINGNAVKTFNVTSQSDNEILYLLAECKSIEFTKDAHLGNVKIYSQAHKDSLKTYVDWRNLDSLRNYGRLRLNTHFESANKINMKFLTSEFFLEDSLWIVNDNNSIQIDSTQISINDFSISSSGQYVKVSGKISENKSDQLMVFLDKFNLAYANPFLKKSDITINGIITGNASISSLYDSPVYTAGANITDLLVNDVPIGSGSLISLWNSKKESVALNGKFMRGEIPTIGFSGFYYPNKESDNFDLELQFQKTQLKLVEKYTANLVSKIGGVATGDLFLKGSPEKPILTGSLEVQKNSFLFDYLNTFYTIPNGLVEFAENEITIKDMLMFDSPISEKGKPISPNTAIINTTITHSYFKNFNVDININAKNLFCLNTNEGQNASYYGKAFATGLIHISTDLKNTTIDIDAKTNKGTDFNIPLAGAEDVSSNDFIRFVNYVSDTVKVDDKYKLDLSGIQLNFNLDVTPDAQVQLIFDSKIGDIIKANGRGNIKMNINTLGQFNIFGDYVIEKGDYLFTLKNIINKKFKIDQGSTIAWHGNPYDAEINLNATYNLRTSLIDLMGESSTTNYSKRVPVECKLKMTDKLMNPTVKFDIVIPNSDQPIQDELLRITQNDGELNKQVFSLLLAGKFQPPSDRASTGTAGAVSSNSSELLSNQLSNWLSQITDQVDIGVNYKAGDQVTSKELQVSLSKQLFNDRMSIDGNFGVANSPTATNNTSSASNLVGDVNIEYKLTQDGKLRVKAYNQTYENTVISNNSPYKQGVGLTYKEEFNTFGELLRRYKAFFKSKKKKEELKEEVKEDVKKDE